MKPFTIAEAREKKADVEALAEVYKSSYKAQFGLPSLVEHGQAWVNLVTAFYLGLEQIEIEVKALKAETSTMVELLQAIESQFEAHPETFTVITELYRRQGVLQSIESGILLTLINITDHYWKIRNGLQDITKFSQTEIDKLNS